MKKKLVSLLSLILAVVMVFPVAVFADETADYTLFYNSTSADKKTVQLSCEGATLWRSSKTEVATVDNTGKVTAVGVGSAYISAEDASLTQLGKFLIEVKSRELSGISIDESKSTKSYIAGTTIKKSDLTVVATYTDGTQDSNFTGYTISPAGALTTDNTSVTVSVGETMSDSMAITVNTVSLEDLVTGIDITAPTANKEYTVGSTLKKSDVKIKVTYVGGTVSETSLADNTDITYSGIDFNASGNCNFATSDIGTKTITVKYAGYEDSVAIKVKAASSSEDNTTTTTYTSTPSGSLTKKAYKVGEKFDATGVTLTITEKTGSTSKTYATLNGSQLTSFINYTFQASDIGVTTKTFEFEYATGIKVSMTFSGLTVTADLDDREVDAITAIRMNDDEYYVGHKFTIADIEEITVEFDGESRDRDIDGEDLDGYEFAQSTNGFSIEVLNANGLRKSTSYRQLIQDNDVQTDEDGKKFVEMRLYYRQGNYTKSSNSTYFEFTVEVGEPDISYIYNGDLIAIYDDLEDALDYTLENDSSWTNFDLDDVRTSKSITLKLGKDFVISSSYDEYSPEHNVIIDLNGYDLTFYSDTVIVDKEDDDFTVTITNSAKTASSFTYKDKSVTLTLGEDDSITFQYDKNADDDYLPGIMTVSVTVGSNGKVTASPTLSSGTVTVGMGSNIKFTITPNSGYAVDTVKVDSKAVATTNNTNYTVSSTGVVTYTLADVEKDSKVEITFAQKKAEWKNPFTDVKSTSTYYEAVEFVHTHELFNGMTDNTFGPNVNMNRAMFVTVLGRLAGLDLDDAEDKYGMKSSFPDITVTSDTKWYVPYIEWAVDYGIVVGRDDGTFDPYAYITKQEMYVMMYRYAVYVEHKQVNLAGVSLTSSDRGEVKDWALDEVKFAHQQNFLVLSGSRIEPEEYAKRWELASLLQKFSVNVLGWAE